MAKTKQIANEREYIIPLRERISTVPRYRRAPKAIKVIKEFIAKHMRVADRDLDKVKIDKWLNQEIWFRGIQKPPIKIKVKAKRDGENIIVTLVDLPDKIKFAKAKEDKLKSETEKKKEKKKSEKEVVETQKSKTSGSSSSNELKEKKEETSEETEEKKENEKEKEQSGKEVELKKADFQAKEQKHVKAIKEPKIRRMALQK
ncbi:MAG: 50S ribosomal protein L31e [Candidatus Pacearchaeota archaeon]|jgi:large subunit ribosomal protein L31e